MYSNDVQFRKVVICLPEMGCIVYRTILIVTSLRPNLSLPGICRREFSPDFFLGFPKVMQMLIEYQLYKMRKQVLHL